MNMTGCRVSFFILLSLFFFTEAANAQVNRYMVFFGNKTGSPYSVDQPDEFLSQRAIERRQKQGIAVVDEDIPVLSAYVDAVQSAGATILYRTKWLNGVLVQCQSSLSGTLEALPFVTKVEYVAPGSRPSPGGRVRSPLYDDSMLRKKDVTDFQLSMIGIDYMHNSGYKGEGILIALCDAGFLGADLTAPFQHIFTDGRFDALTSYDFVHGGHDVFRTDDHGTRAFSIIGAYQDGIFTGGAHKADFVLFVTEDIPTEYRIEEYNWLFAAERADSTGVDIMSVSLGYNWFDDFQMDYLKSEIDGETAVITVAAERAAARGMAVVVSAGNEGNNAWQIITPPADGKNVLAVGAVTTAEERSPSSSIGPTADGRIKPDVAALGTGVSVVVANGGVSQSSGTSFSAPLVTSLVAGVWQMLPDLTVKELFDTIRNTASQSSNPDNLLGYGIPNFMSVLQVTSVESDKLSNPVHVFPNPFSNAFMIRPHNSAVVENMQMEVMDAKGSVLTLETRTVPDEGVAIDLSGNAPGLYLLRVRVNNQLTTHRLMKLE